MNTRIAILSTIAIGCLTSLTAGDIAPYHPTTLAGKITVNECDLQEFNTHKNLGKWTSIHLEGEMSLLRIEKDKDTNKATSSYLTGGGYMDIKRKVTRTENGFSLINICEKENLLGDKIKIISRREMTPKLVTTELHKTIIKNNDYEHKSENICYNSNIPGVLNSNYSVSEPFSRSEKLDCLNGDEITELTNFSLVTQNEGEIIFHSSDTNENNLNAVVTVSRDRDVTGFRIKYSSGTTQYRSRYDMVVGK